MTARTILLTSSILLVSAGAALADGDNWRQRQINETKAQEARAIEEGRYKGELTRREYRELKAEQERIADLERKAKADGHISRREFRDIREAQASAAKHIDTEAHDGQVSFWRRWLYRTR